MSDGPFYVHCLSGKPAHVMEAVPGSALETKCRERAEAGYLDALCLNYTECPDCVEDRRSSARRDADYNSLFGCPLADFDGMCTEDCPCKNPEQIADSPYDSQVQYPTAVV